MSVRGRAAYLCASHDGVFLEIVRNGQLPREFRTMEKVHVAVRLGVGEILVLLAWNLLLNGSAKFVTHKHLGFIDDGMDSSA